MTVGPQGWDPEVNLGDRGLLLFDGDCGFCTWSVGWAQRWVRPKARFQPWQRADIDAFGITADACTEAVQFVHPDGHVDSGGRAVCALLRSGRAPWPLMSRCGSAPGVRTLVDVAYRLVARHRHRLPGATPACAVQ